MRNKGAERTGGVQLTLFPPEPIFADSVIEAACGLVEAFGWKAVAEVERCRQSDPAPAFQVNCVAVRRAVKFILNGKGTPMM